MGKYATHYTEEELRQITEQWRKDKKRVDEEYIGRYYARDVDREYEKYLNNKNLRRLFNFASFCYHGIRDADIVLYRDEPKIAEKAYWGILENGYYDKSKLKEKEDRRKLGIAVRRYYWIKRGRKR
ncbi:MAG: hypothetical protein A3B70_05640 [Deltaproteobacteria bacterium RIFCSPHIGHO2_02_FULL_40_11]|nr:MAG: hypothetical protein A3B70_05640 [Deltaproteobacteria bacterium RIFCSPHIGHO2_02_FULL_40_11]